MLRTIRRAPWLFVLALVVLLAGQQYARSAEPTGDSKLTAAIKQIEAKLEELRGQGKEKEANQFEDVLLKSLGRFAVGLQQQPKSAQHLTLGEQKIQGASERISELRKHGDEATADRLSARLKRIKEGLRTGQYDFEPGDDPEVHWVSIQRGSVLPKEFHKEHNRFKIGFSEVHLQYTAKPIILLLTAADPVLWKIKKDEGVRVHAVLVSANQKIVGLDSPLQITVDGERIYDERTATAVTGRPTSTKLSSPIYDGKPIVIGALNEEWLVGQLSPRIDGIVKAAARAQLKGHLANLQNLRFQAIHFPGSPHSERGPGFAAASLGTFTVAGPLEDTLRPLRDPEIRALVDVRRAAADPLQFGLMRHHDFVVWEGKDLNQKATNVPRAASAARARFRSLTYDSKRNRIVLTTDGREGSALWAYNIKDSSWKELVGAPYEIDAIAYDEQRDIYHGYVGISRFRRDKTSRLLQLANDGSIEQNVVLEVARDENRSFHWEGQPQLIVAGELLVRIDPSHARDTGTGYTFAVKDRLHVMDPRTGTTLYSGQCVAHDGSTNARTDAPKKITGNGVLAQIDRKAAKAAALLRRLKQAGKVDVAARLGHRLETIHAGFPGGIPKTDQERLMLVGFYDPHETHVHVSDKSGPIVLAVCTYESAKWTVTAEDGVRLAKIIVSGHDPQELVRAPEGVEVVTGERFQTYGPDDDSWDGAVNRLRELTGLSVSAFAGRYNAKPGMKIVVGPEDGTWRAQQILNALDALIVEAEASADEDDPPLKRHRFFALHVGALPGVIPEKNLPGPGPGTPMCAAQFSIDGPLVGRGIPLGQPGAMHTAAVDPVNGLFYFPTQQGFKTLDPITGQQSELALPNLKGNRIEHFTIDPEGAILVSMNRGLSEIDLKTGTVVTLRNRGLDGPMVYAPQAKTIYAIRPDGGDSRVRSLMRFNRSGALLEMIPLERAIQVGRHRFDGLSQLIYFDGYLAIIRHAHSRGRAAQSPPSITVVRAADGTIVHEGELKPHADRKDLAPQEIAKLWESMLGKDRAATSAVWELAAAQDDAVKFLRVQFEMPPPPVDQLEVATLVQSLSSQEFSVRDQAFRRLAAMGSPIESMLANIVKAQRDAEVLRRLNSLIEAWKKSITDHAEERRLVAAVNVLAMLDSRAARDLLREVAAKASPAVQRRAESVLDSAKPGGC